MHACISNGDLCGLVDAGWNTLLDCIVLNCYICNMHASSAAGIAYAEHVAVKLC
jgi:hypothetical protein